MGYVKKYLIDLEDLRREYVDCYEESHGNIPEYSTYGWLSRDRLKQAIDLLELKLSCQDRLV